MAPKELKRFKIWTRIANMTGSASPDKKDQHVDENVPVNSDDLLRELGGCGRFQVLLSVVIQTMKTVVCWGMQGNAFFAFVPNWRCVDDVDGYNNSLPSVNPTSAILSGDSQVIHGNASGDLIWNQQCKTSTGSTCTSFQYDDSIHTFVSEFDLVCDLTWVTATITSLQMAGMCVGSLLSGHVADAFGRKIPFFLSMLILTISHTVAYFSVNWVMLAVAKVFVGIGSSFFLTLYCTIQSEYSLSRWRTVMISFPSWSIESSLLALVAWQLHDWKYVTLIMIVMALVFHSAWCFVPESFRWFIAKERYDDAEAVVERVAYWNKQPVPDFERMRKAVSAQESQRNVKQYSVIELFRKRSLLKITIPLMACWLSLGIVAYGINFGIKSLSGNIYFNLFLFSIASTPSKLLSMYLQNKLGRKAASIIAFSFCGVGGLLVGIIQYIDIANRDEIINYSALVANMAVDMAWGPVQTITLELYPTVVRNNGFGFLSLLARLGAVIGPQFVYLSDFVPGLLYFVVAMMSLLSIAGFLCLRETIDASMEDQLHRTTVEVPANKEETAPSKNQIPLMRQNIGTRL